MGKKKWMQDLNIKKGALRKKLRVKKGKKITVSQLEKASKSKNIKTKRQAVLAKTFRKAGKKKGK